VRPTELSEEQKSSERLEQRLEQHTGSGRGMKGEGGDVT
jgi:hypothetical protein